MFKLLVLTLAIFGQTWAKPGHLHRIIGGSPAEQGQFPFLASLQYPEDQFHFCGAGIINERWLVSAGHCAEGEDETTFVVYVGSVYLDREGTYYEVETLVVHPDFDYWSLQNDISLIKVAKDIVFNDNVQPINLPIDITVNPGDVAIATGWGDTKYPSGETPNQLQFLSLNVVSNEDCAEALDDELYDGQICVGGENGYGLCYGDSGSPLVYVANNKSYTVGAVSWGHPCAAGYPDAFTRVSYFVSWIQKQIASK